MSGLISNVVYNTQALNNHSAGLQVTGNNLANVNSTSYARQQLKNSTTPAEAAGGLTRYTIEQIRDAVLDENIVRENADLGSLEAQNDVLNQLNSLFAESLQENLSTSLEYSTDSDSTGLTAALDSFFAAWSDYSVDPSDSTAQEIVYQSGEMLVEYFNTMSSRLDEIETDVNTRISDDVDEANTLLNEIASLNEQIVRAELGGNDTATTLRNQRQEIVEELGKILNISTDEQANGTLIISSTDNTGATVTLLNHTTVNSLTNNAGVLGLADGTTLGLSSGSLYGYSAVLTGDIADARSDLDLLAANLTSSVNTAYGADFFDAAGLTAGTIALDSALTADSIYADLNNASGNEIALAISELASSEIAGLGNTFQGYTITTASAIAASYSNNQTQLEYQELVSTMLDEQRTSISGVNLNEEVTNMMVLQRAFQATSRVVNVLDQLLSVVVNELKA
ncbi:MAG: flagellar hook-associated protein FlgK [Opitutales bacterium]|nr:flagellar hook-associated protein FlgK [Opitutales bacterium]